MPTSVSIDSVTTGDAVPAASPHRISAQATKDHATLKFTPTSSDASVIRAWRTMLGGVGRSTGKRVGGAGLVCGLDVCGPNSRSLSRASGAQVTDDITYSEAAPNSDGSYTINVYALSEGQGWNT